MYKLFIKQARFMSPYFKKAICLVLLFVNISWAEMLREDMEQATWEDVRSELSIEERERLDKALVSAAAKGEVDTVLNLIDEGADVNCGDGYGRFWQQGLWVHLPFFGDSRLANRSCKYTALMMAAWKGGPEMTQLLIEKGALLNLTVLKQDDMFRGKTATNFAEGDTLEILLENGALFGYCELAPCYVNLMDYEEYKAHKRRTDPFYYD